MKLRSHYSLPKLTCMLLLLVLTAFVNAQEQWTELSKIFASDRATSDQFGYSVFIDVDYAIVGAPYNYVSYTNQGSAYIFKREGENWVEKKKLTASDGAGGDNFGYSVCINGDYAIVGAPYDYVSYTGQGSAYIFKREGENWVEKKKLTASDRATYDYFGYSVCINGDYTIVGAYGDDSSRGSAYIFKREGENWVEKKKLVASDRTTYDYFGYSVCIDEDYIIVGAYGDDDLGSESGSVYIFMREVENWVEKPKIRAWDGRPGDNFGCSVSISGDYAIMGARYCDVLYPNDEQGAAYIFKREDGVWNPKKKLTASDGNARDYFGYSVSIDGEYSIVGACQDDATYMDQGSAYIFKREGETWLQKKKLIASDGAESDCFGWSVCIDQNYPIVGAYLVDDLEIDVWDCGAAYVFGSPDNLVVEPPGDFICDGNEGEWPQGFTAIKKEYTLTNISDTNSIAWRVETDVNWLYVDPCEGPLLPHGQTIVTISITDKANDFDPNVHTGKIFFKNLSSGRDQARNATLTVKNVPGEIEVEPNEVDFGDVIVGLSRTEPVTISNMDINPRHELIVEDMSLGSYLEDFNDGQAQGWQAHSNGYWDVVFEDWMDPNNGEYKPAATSNYVNMQSAYTVRKWKDLYVKVKIRRGYNGYEAGIFVRASEDFDYPNSTGSAYLIAEDGSQNYSISKYISGERIYLQSSWSSYLNYGDVGNIIEIVVEGSTITVYFNGNLEWSGSDMDIAGPGRVGLFAYQPYTDYNCYFDDVQVKGRGLKDGFKLEVLPPGGPPWVLKTPYDSNEPNSIIVDVNFAPNEVGEYQSTLVIRSDDEDEPIVEVKLKGKGIRDSLVVEPNENSVYEFSGHPGGPFLPPYQTYDLKNIGPNDINWTVEPNVPWLNADPNGGTLKPNQSIRVKVRPNDEAKNLEKGKHYGGLIFFNSTTGKDHRRPVCLDAYTESKIWVKPPYFDVTIPQGATLTEILKIGNKGDCDLTFGLSCQTKSTPPQPASSGTRGIESGVSGLEAKDIKIYDLAKFDFSKLDEASYAPGELLVRFAPKADRSWPNMAEKNATLQTSFGGATIVQEYKIVPGLCLVKLPAGVTIKNTLFSLNNTAGILYAEPNYKIKLLSDCQNIPNDARFNELWGMHNTGQTGGTLDADIDAPEAWCIRTDCTNIVVAVIDSGVDYTHSDLKANIWINDGEDHWPLGVIGPEDFDGVDDDNNGRVDDICGFDYRNNDGNSMDDNYHGTHCAGITGALGNNTQGVAGACWKVKIMVLKFTDPDGSGDTAKAIDCIQYAIDLGTKIMSNSWGGGPYSQGLKDAINAADNAGILFVAAAGNGDFFGNPIDNDTTPHYPSSYDLNNIIAVMATDRYDNSSSFSNYGTTSVDIAAPGTDILSTFPTYMTSEMTNNGYSTYYETISGTSMAAPHVTGACALVWSVCPTLSHLEVKDVIMQTVDPLTSLEGKCVSGGRLNLYKAVLKAEELADGEPFSWCELKPSAGTVAPGGVNDVNVVFDANRAPGTYRGDIVIESNDPYRGTIKIPVTMTVEPVDFFTELFDLNEPYHPYSVSASNSQVNPHQNDMANLTLAFFPDGSYSYYSGYTCKATNFLVDSNDANEVFLKDDDYIAVYLGDGKDVNLYGTAYDTFYIGSNGYITFTSADILHHETITDHFKLPRISALFDDLDPSAGGKIWWKQLNDRAVVTFENVPEFSRDNANSFQVEMFFNGTIRITWLKIDAQDGLVGLSEGNGVPAYFVESDLSEYKFGDVDDDCDVDFADLATLVSYWLSNGCTVENDWCGGADIDRDGKVDLEDFSKYAMHWLECIRN